ncbi:thiopurine S-methyltransferase [Parahaliea mediterranea]|uniref:Thiopurine S-methyltransferase n=1 Tax=Parahaliea mediterranea TaxID=651086 RepID=A0A939DHH1_9GAMM|nr:thiopurine S-methyltransferase [Parahaliea mediterranea]MBN7798334.1 thiopurine S-methyltransferase [Parahaliea mediterranea]
MDTEFWHHKWREGDIAFHEGAPNTLLQAHFQRLDIAGGSRVFLPLCGKTRDIAWLLEHGYRVAGAELSELAIRQLFDELGLEPRIDQTGNLTRYSADNIDIFVGDIFDLRRDTLGPVQAVYDRAALVALPADIRRRYSAHLVEITDAAPQLLITFDYDQSQMDGPPFSIDRAEVSRHYGAAYRMTELARQPVPGGLKGKAAAMESAWLLRA